LSGEKVKSAVDLAVMTTLEVKFSFATGQSSMPGTFE
jgi:hypothetical protein